MSSSLQFGKTILVQEASAVLQLAESLGESFDRAVELLLSLPAEGRVVVSGLGKASFIAMKISATLASTGTPSFFLHPAEALHGDLGRFTPYDRALLLSNSGETPEVVSLLPYLEKIGCPVISITGAAESRLAQKSTVLLHIGNLAEAGPHGMAPTTSTTAMLALGDALAMSVFEQRGGSQGVFAALHPGGKLGKALTTVAAVMRTGDALCLVSEDKIAREVIHQIVLTRGRPGAALILDAELRLRGIFTDGDLRRSLDSDPEFLAAPISNVMTHNPKSISSDKLVQDALAVMVHYKIDELPVVDGAGRPVGLLDIQDLVDLRSR